jgi:hypothetical protein
VSLHKRAVVEMANQVQTKAIGLIDQFRKSWFSKVDQYETAVQVQKEGGAESLKLQLKECPEYLGLWQKYFSLKEENQVQSV